VGGSGPAVVLVHGLAVSSRYFVPLAERLVRSRLVLAPDLPGYGRSATPKRALGVEALAGALLEWLDLAGLETPTVVANSFGCQIAVELAVTAPDRIARLVLVGPAMDPAARTLVAQTWRVARDVVLEPPALTLIELRDYVRMGPRRILTTARAALAYPMAEKLPLVCQPTLIVRGARDPIVSQPWVERMTALLPAGRIAIIAGPHAAHWGAADAVARLVEEFE
jgi:pimeloyl-ACP methyl ester carboxylesterase